MIVHLNNMNNGVGQRSNPPVCTRLHLGLFRGSGLAPWPRGGGPLTPPGPYPWLFILVILLLQIRNVRRGWVHDGGEGRGDPLSVCKLHTIKQGMHSGAAVFSKLLAPDEC